MFNKKRISYLNYSLCVFIRFGGGDMCNYILKIESLTKKYGKETILKDINMNIKKGDIYGFIGKNGAGKTSLIRVITGLSFYDSGNIELFGESMPDMINLKRSKIGCIIESPALYSNMTAKQNLEIIRAERGIKDKDCIDKVLNIVKLDNIEKKKVKNFSLGMRQKLALAIALLGNPEFLILDEPVNGLDPTSIIEFRNLIKTLNNKYGTTILISSHLLGELHQLATTYGFINEGKIIEEISQEELNLRCNTYIDVYVDMLHKAIEILEEKLHFKYKVLDNNIRIYESSSNVKKIIKEFALEGIGIEKIQVKSDDLEKYFIDLIRRKDNE